MMVLRRDDGLIVDLGMNNGDDTAYYLRQGFRVVGVEANPQLADSVRKRFAGAVSERRLIVINGAIWDGEGQIEFYVNLENSHWSSMDHAWASRNNSRIASVPVSTVKLCDIFEAHGVPFYLKIDIEGADHIALQQIGAELLKPNYISVEDCRFGPQYIEMLGLAGYDGFKLSDQSLVPHLVDETTAAPFPAGASGPYGEALAGEWYGYTDFIELYARTVRDPSGRRLAPQTQWWDIHATLPDAGSR